MRERERGREREREREGERETERERQRERDRERDGQQWLLRMTNAITKPCIMHVYRSGQTSQPLHLV